MSKQLCKSCIHYYVCKWAVDHREILCADFLDHNSYDEGYSDGYLQGTLDQRHDEESNRRGKWIMDKEHTKNPLLWYRCNLCGAYHSPTKFCPECGANMRGDNNV